MRRLAAFLSVVILSLASVATAQTRRPPARRTAAVPLPPPMTVAPDITCPTPLGVGVTTKRSYCDVLSGRDPAGGVLVPLPSHRGPVTLTFDLHNRHTYSEEQVKAGRAYARYTGVIGVLTMDNTLIRRAMVQSEFRKASDLVERIGGGAGPAGVKAVAPSGTEHITITIPEEESQVSLLGEKLVVDRPEGSATYASAGRPVAVISNVMIEYRPGSPPKSAPPGNPAR
jgi:hypothetical protein